ncbi:MAG: DUF5615 family PIN-like protein [Planctomycetes bacterium]|nr:DUF5615 family PIN-like protein [Planctomycetota bacterium]
MGIERNKTKSYGPCKTRFYADENIPTNVIEYLRHHGFHVDSAIDLGYSSRDDKFQLQEARRRKSVLLTRDKDFMDHKRFPFHNLKDTAVVILRTLEKSGKSINFGFMLSGLIDQIGISGNKNINGLKIELLGPRIKFHARLKGAIKTDEIDISQEIEDRNLFEEH